MFLDDSLENRRIAVRVPGALGIDDGNRSALANPKAVCFCPQDAALLRQPTLLQPALEQLPRRQTAIFFAALRVGLIAAEKDVPPRHADPDAVRDRSLRLVSHQASAPQPSAIKRRTPRRSR